MAPNCGNGLRARCTVCAVRLPKPAYGIGMLALRAAGELMLLLSSVKPYLSNSDIGIWLKRSRALAMWVPFWPEYPTVSDIDGVSSFCTSSVQVSFVPGRPESLRCQKFTLLLLFSVG